MTRQALSVCSSLLLAALSVASIQSARSDNSTDQDRALVARDVCSGFAARYVNTQDKNADISFSRGKFTIKRNAGSVTVFEDAVPITDIPGFTYLDYTDCLRTIMEAFEKSRADEEGKENLEAFTAGYELSYALNVGICLESAAKGGLYFGNMDTGEPGPFDKKAIKELLESVSQSISARVQVVSGKDINADLVSNLMFYEFVDGRILPYFKSSAIDKYIGGVSSTLDGEALDHFRMGALAAQMARALPYAVVLNTFIKQTKGRNDPSSLRAQKYFPPSLQCLVEVYEKDYGRLDQKLQEYDLDSVSVPWLDEVLASPPSHLDGFYDSEVTSPIRSQLMDK